jgi:hypothetical protein
MSRIRYTDKEKVRNIPDFVRRCQSAAASCRQRGISYQTLINWRSRATVNLPMGGAEFTFREAFVPIACEGHSVLGVEGHPAEDGVVGGGVAGRRIKNGSPTKNPICIGSTVSGIPPDSDSCDQSPALKPKEIHLNDGRALVLEYT